MEYSTLLKAGIRRHKGSLLGVFILILLVSLSLGTVLTIWANSSSYIRSEMNRAGFGAITAWVSGLTDEDALLEEITALPEISTVEIQQLIYTNYETNGQESDSEGQLILLHPGETRYRFFTDDLSSYRSEIPQIEPGEVYVSPSLISMFGITVGDKITYPIARAGGNMTFTIKGYYEDPFMGSSMIGMKGFLICPEDFDKIAQMIGNSGIDALARVGAMLHIFTDTNLISSQLSNIINENTTLSEHIEFVHSADAIRGFMLILQNAFSSLLIAFVLVLLAVVFVVLGHSIGSTIESDYVNMGILKTIGFTSQRLRRIQLLQYTFSILIGMALGLALTVPVSRLVSRVTLTTTGIRIPANFPILWGVGIYGIMLFLLAAFIALKTARIGKIAPMHAIRGAVENSHFNTKRLPAIDGTNISIQLAGRQLLTGKRKYISACMVALLLVFFASMIGRMNTWLGPDGKGMMDAFNPADHDIGVQTFGTLSVTEAETVVRSYTDITDSYLLAMPSVAVEGVDYTANVISEPERFHILSGRTCAAENEIVITEFVAADLNLNIGDNLTVTGDSGSDTYTISGIYSCANDMGANVGMNQEGYLKIGRDDPQIWCHHYFLADPTQKAAITQTLESTYGGDIHIHENTWSGLFGIISAMQALVIFMGIMVMIFILIVTVMTGSKILAAEQRDIGIYKAIGFTNKKLRFSFALRFGIAAIPGSLLGILLAAVLTDPLVSSIMKFAGISNFASYPSTSSVLLPAATVIILFTAFAYLASGKIKKADLTILITE